MLKWLLQSVATCVMIIFWIYIMRRLFHFTPINIAVIIPVLIGMGNIIRCLVRFGFAVRDELCNPEV